MRIGQAFIHALRGIRETFRSEQNFKIHAVFTALALLAGCWVNLSTGEWLWLALSVTLVFGMELLNTAIEAFCDVVSPSYHPFVQKAKDAAAGAVLIATVFAVLVGIILFGPRLWCYFFHSAFDA